MIYGENYSADFIFLSRFGTFFLAQTLPGSPHCAQAAER